jgi:hypothetical protein
MGKFEGYIIFPRVSGISLAASIFNILARDPPHFRVQAID